MPLKAALRISLAVLCATTVIACHDTTGPSDAKAPSPQLVTAGDVLASVSDVPPESPAREAPADEPQLADVHGSHFTTATLATALSNVANPVSVPGFTEFGGHLQSAVLTTVQQGFPTNGSSYVVFSSGDARTVGAAGSFNACVFDAEFGSLCDRGGLRVQLVVPATADELRFDYRYFAVDYPTFEDPFQVFLEVGATTTRVVRATLSSEIPSKPCCSAFLTWGPMRQAVINVATYRGQTITLRFQASDRSDQINSGGALVDNLSFITLNAAPVLAAVGNRAVTEGNSLSFTATASDPDGNALTFSLVGAPSGASIHPSTGAFQWTPADGPATATFKVVVSDGSLADEEEITVTVNNAAPLISALSATASPIQLVGGTASAAVQITFSDAAGTNDTYSAAIQCGDGTTLALAGVTSPQNAPCNYSEAGVYTVRATISDEDGGTSDEAVFQYVVVYDPSEGFVTGGGWINSPAGSYAADPTLAGIAKFGFVSRYKKGATVPTGNTEFEFTAGDLYFVSTSYEWLVVAGSRAQFKGSGTINGAGSYKFILTAVDSRLNGNDNADAFRIKITDASGNVVYDNQASADEVSGSGTQLGGGSIVIHNK